MPEPIRQWWSRRQVSRGAEVPYPVGSYRDAWQSFPMLVRQYHPEFNDGIVLSQIPPAADVFLCWQCDVGHVFVATPAEQRSRPGRERERRRSSWCPDCLEGARPRTPAMPMREGPVAEAPAGPRAVAPAVRRAGGAAGAAAASGASAAPARPASAAPAPARRSRQAARPAASTVCSKTPALPAGEPFASVCAPSPASAVEGELRAFLLERLEFTAGLNAIRLARPFFDHLEAWPDVILPELRVAVEYDSTGRFGLEHVGRREEADRRKDRALRGAGWEVVRIRTGRLPALGPHDLQVGSLSKKALEALVDELRVIRGALIVDAYLLR
ncbi:hypothetical protein [Frondihabitans peucedani]|uniref:Zinc-ribbon domain-containing protein n=1 Tax=Frondihabitans peucedani TaxID=598626 RepID=A0ABP8DX80_9MICO